VPHLIWTLRAVTHVQRLHRFLVDKDADAARRAIKAIRAGVKVLARQPGTGRPLDDLGPEFREWLIDFGDSGYVVLYRVDAQEVSLLAIRHQKEAGYR
jgi:plasmid stabilization system protein ParE